MTRLYRNRLDLRPRADNHLPQLANPIATTAEQVPTVNIGARVYEPGLADLEASNPPADAPRDEQAAWRIRVQGALASATYVSFDLAPHDALNLARNILRLVDDNGCIREPRSIRTLRPTSKE
jgi:hypothetical protein